MTAVKNVQFVGSASGLGASDSRCYEGPLVLKNSPYMRALTDFNLDFEWNRILQPDLNPSSKSQAIIEHNQHLAATVAELVKNKQLFTVFGGDHSCAIGTWSGVKSQIEGPLGLIWIDAHMDSHTPQTSPTGNIHGMPLAALLGYGADELTLIAGAKSKLNPAQICLIGIRSYEDGEAALLKKLNIRIYYMDEVNKRGLQAVMKEAIELVKTGTVAYGVTLDIDSIDPDDAPATGVSEPLGLSADELCEALCQIAGDKKLIGTEIVEFDPHLDKDQKTEKLIPKLLAAMLVGKY